MPLFLHQLYLNKAVKIINYLRMHGTKPMPSNNSPDKACVQPATM